MIDETPTQVDVLIEELAKKITIIEARADRNIKLQN